MQEIMIVGNLVRDPEYSPAQGDKSQYAKFTVAVDNEFGDLTSYFDCIVFGKTADNVDKYLSKGRQVAVKGRHEQGEVYQDKVGNNRRSWSLRVERVKFLRDKSSLVASDVTEERQRDVPDSWEQADEDNPFE